jgi:hypothetical protein
VDNLLIKYPDLHKKIQDELFALKYVYSCRERESWERWERWEVSRGNYMSNILRREVRNISLIFCVCFVLKISSRNSLKRHTLNLICPHIHPHTYTHYSHHTHTHTHSLSHTFNTHHTHIFGIQITFLCEINLCII